MRLLFVEDDKMLGRATAEGLRTAYAVDWVASAEEASDALSTTPYDLVVLDVNLPGQSGLEFLKSLRETNDHRPVLLLTARDSVRHRIDGLNSGADDYLVKPFDLDELIARIAALIRRSNGRSNPEITCCGITYDPNAKSARKNGKTIKLSGREIAILEILMTNAGRVISRAQIEDHIYDWNNGDIESNTIEVHISSLRRKLNKDLIQTIRGVGYLIVP